jgi:RNA polymerase sigma-70 factor (ECF subfamily)
MATSSFRDPSSEPLVDDLLRAVAGGSRVAFVEVYNLTGPRVLGLINTVLGDPAQSEEVAQEVFVEIWQTAARFDPVTGSGAAWVMTVAHRRAVDRVRASQASRGRDREAPRNAVAEGVDASVEQERVQAALACLSESQREAIDLAYRQGFTHTEIALRLGVPQSAVKTWLYEGLLALREQLRVLS